MANRIIVNLDTSKNQYNIFECKQNDDLILEASIFENGIEKDVTTKAITINCTRSDGTYVVQNTDITRDKNKITANLKRDFTRVDGLDKLEIVLLENEKQNTTFDFNILVKPSVLKTAVEESKDTVIILEELGNKIVEAGQVKAQTEELIATGGAATKGDIATVNSSLEQMTKLIYPTMSNQEIQNIIKDGGHFKFVEGIYNFNFFENDDIPYCLDINSNTEIEMCKNVLIRIPPNDKEIYRIFNIVEKENIKISGGTIIGDKTLHLGTTGEYGHGIAIYGSKNITINDVIIKDCWGDGIIVGESKGGNSVTIIQSENVVIKNCTLTNNRRQGLSITSLIKGLVSNNIMELTSGTLPSTGIDVEPNRYCKTEKIVIEKNIIRNNAKEGILITKRDDFGEETTLKEITVRENSIYNNDSGIHIKSSEDINVLGNFMKSNSRLGLWGGKSKNLLIENNTVTGNGESGIMLILTNNSRIHSNTVTNNSVMGIYIRELNYTIVESNTVSYNGSHGIGVSISAHNNIISNNILIENALQSGHSNIAIYSNSDRNIITNNKCRVGEETKKPDYGICLKDSTSSSNIVTNNDCFNGGGMYGIFVDGAVSTQFCGGNIVKSGVWSTEPI